MRLSDKVLDAIRQHGPTTTSAMTSRLGCGAAGMPTKAEVQKCVHNLAYRKQLASTGTGRDRVYYLPSALRDGVNPTPAPTPAPTPGLDLSALIDSMTTSLANQFAASLAAKLAAAVESQLAPPQGGGKGTVRKPRVTVVGLLPGQAALIEKEFGDAVELHFVTSDQTASQKLKGLCRTSAAVLTMTGFISHAAEDLIKANGGNLIRVQGGMSSLRDAITEAYVGATA